MEGYTWIPFYEEISLNLLNYKENRKLLIEKINEFQNDCNKFTHLECDDVLEDIDPFTFFAIFNRGSLSNETRIKICHSIKKSFNISSSVPNDFLGIPVQNYTAYCFYHYKDSPKRNNKVFDALWELFEVASKDDIFDSKKTTFYSIFNKCLSFELMQEAKLTIGLFQAFPNRFISLDTTNKKFFETNNIQLSKDYLDNILKVREEIKKLNYETFASFSAAANEEIKKQWQESSGNFSRDRWLEKLEDKNIKDTFLRIQNGLDSNNCISWGKVLNNDRETIKDVCKDLKGAKKHSIQNLKEAFDIKSHGPNFDNIEEIKMRNELFLLLNGKNDNQSIETGEIKMDNKINSRNIILYGPPGTGKTYNTIDYALRIIDEQFYTDNKDNRKVLKEKFDELKASGQIAFTTFHQSYGYEEFIEGIKPVIADDNTSSMTYEVKDGIFKLFCEKALKPNIEKQDASKLGLNSDPSFWKVSLKGTHENEIRTDCLNNGYIRIGYDSYGQDIDETTDFTKEGGRNVLTAFIYSMKIGDVILSCYTNNSIDAVGIVTGECQWRDDFAEYKRIRTVKWIKFPKPIEEIDKHNGNKTFTLGAVYKLNNIDKEWVYSLIVDKNYSTSKNSKKYVFIIDEINRGNISKIFGELITLIEDSKRIGEDEEMKCVLPYSNDENKPFGIPNNVYILGTMNTADRSISLIDTALRRRFQFIEMMPKPEIKELKGLEVDGISIPDMIKTINERIEFLYDREHQIGHSYFMKLCGEKNNTIDNLSNIFKNNILPLLQEYFYDDYEKIRLVLGDNQKHNPEIEFITEVESKSNNLFGNSDNDIEDKTIYRINKDAFDKIDSYKFMK